MRLPLFMILLLTACAATRPAVEAGPPLLAESFVMTIENDTEDAIRVYAAFEQHPPVPLGDIQSQRTRSFDVTWENTLFRVGVRSATSTGEPVRWSESIQPEVGDSLFLRWWGSWPGTEPR